MARFTLLFATVLLLFALVYSNPPVKKSLIGLYTSFVNSIAPESVAEDCKVMGYARQVKRSIIGSIVPSGLINLMGTASSKLFPEEKIEEFCKEAGFAKEFVKFEPATDITFIDNEETQTS